MIFDVVINGESLNNSKLFAVQRPNIPAPNRIYNTQNVLNSDGTRYEQTDYYEDIEITVEFNYRSVDQSMFAHKFREYKKRLLISKTISFSDDLEFFYKVKKVIIGENSRSGKEIGKFDVTFIVDPYTYLQRGTEKTGVQMCKYNNYDKCFPIYYISGNGDCTLTVNENEFDVQVGQDIIIDSKLKIAYREDGTYQNVNVTGDYDDLALVPGINAISLTDGFELEIIPNWREI